MKKYVRFSFLFLFLSLLTYTTAHSQADTGRRFKFSGTISWEIPFGGSREFLNLQKGWGAGLVADYDVTKKWGFTLQGLYKSTPYGKEDFAMLIFPNRKQGNIPFGGIYPWQIYSVCGGVRIRLREWPVHRTILEGFAGLGWLTEDAGTFGLYNIMK